MGLINLPSNNVSLRLPNQSVSSLFFCLFVFYASNSLSLTPSLPLPLPPPFFRGCSSSETESEAGDLLDQQFEELNNKLNSVTDPTGFLRMVSRNNLFNR